MKHGNLILVTLCLILLAGCSGWVPEPSFRVTASSFEPGETVAFPGAPPDPCSPTPCITLAAEGNIPGTPAGDSYQTTGVVWASGGDIRIFPSSGLGLIGRDLQSGESPTAVLISFRAQYLDDVPGGGIAETSLTVRDEQGTVGLILRIHSLGGFIIEGMEFAQTTLSHPESGTVAYLTHSLHTIVITMNFESKQGEVTVSQFGAEATLDFELPQAFGIAQSLEVVLGTIGSDPDFDTDFYIGTPVANFVFLE